MGLNIGDTFNYYSINVYGHLLCKLKILNKTEYTNY